jgi:hypothetical protein
VLKVAVYRGVSMMMLLPAILRACGAVAGATLMGFASWLGWLGAATWGAGFGSGEVFILVWSNSKPQPNRMAIDKMMASRVLFSISSSSPDKYYTGSNPPL